MAFTLLILQALVAVIGLFVYQKFIRKRPNHKPPPPGPKPLPIVGNLFDLPPKDVPEFMHWQKHSVYGPVSSVTVFGQTLVVVHDAQAAHEIFEKKSQVTSGRPRLEFAGPMCGYDNFFTLRQFDDICRRQRRFIQEHIGSKKQVAELSHVLELEAGRLLLRTLEDPENLVQHFKTEAGALILNITYGYNVQPDGTDPLVDLIERMMDNFSNAIVPLKWVVDAVPFIQHLPEGLPGMPFVQTARQWRKRTSAVADLPFDFVREQDNPPPSLLSKLLRQLGREKLSPEDERDSKWTSAAMYAAGADTSVNSLVVFVLAMILYPEIQRKAREEVDNITGGTRLPMFEDRNRLPYIDAIICESMRWFPIVPMGVAHVAQSDFFYEGYLIPKGSIITPAIGHMMHDPKVYHEPQSFCPERFLEPRNEPRSVAPFGFGRRKCPGRYLAEASIFLTISRIVAVFNLAKARDEHGNEIDVELKHSPGVLDHPVPFKYSITPRSEKHAELIRNFELEHPWAESDSGRLNQEVLKEVSVDEE